METENNFQLSGAISCIWTKLFTELYHEYVDVRGTYVVQNMIKYLKAIDLALQNNNIADLLPLLKKYQKYLNSLLYFIDDQNILDAVGEIIEGNVQIEKKFKKNGLDLKELNVYVKHSAIRLNSILILNNQC